MTANSTARLAVDIGGTFIDVVLEVGDRLVTAKLPTTADGPERAVLDGVARVLADGSVPPEQVGLFVHGTTLATNAIIERQGARIRLPLCCLGQVDPAASVAWVKGCIRPSDTNRCSIRAERVRGAGRLRCVPISGGGSVLICAGGLLSTRSCAEPGADEHQGCPGELNGFDLLVAN